MSEVGIVLGATPFVGNTHSSMQEGRPRSMDLKIARNLHVHLKDGKQKEFIELLESQILPVLRQQTGFQDQLTLLEHNRALVISLWDNRKNVQAYQNAVFPKMAEKLNPLLQFPPNAEIFEVATSTLSKAA